MISIYGQPKSKAVKAIINLGNKASLLHPNVFDYQAEQFLF